MNKFLFLVLALASVNLFSQNILQDQFFLNNRTNTDNTIERVQSQQATQVFASNVSMNNKIQPLARINGAINITRAIPVVRKRVVNNVARNNANHVGNMGVPQNANPSAYQIDINVINDNNIPINIDPVQMQMQYLVLENQAIPVGIANEAKNNFTLNIKLPKINWKPIKLGSKSVTKSHKSFSLKAFFLKTNRKMQGKLSFGKKLKIKVDNCFKW